MGDGPFPTDTADTTHGLLRRIDAGDREALDELCRRYLPRLKRWAAGRLPRAARDMVDTDDLVQEVLSNATRYVHGFEYRRERAFQAYVRRALQHRIQYEVQRTIQRQEVQSPPRERPSSDCSPLEELAGKETIERYEKALESLSPIERDAIVSRLEMGLGYAQLAETLGRPSADAARKLVSRSLVKLAVEMSRDG